MNNKETLIKTLRGSVAQLNELSDMTEGIDVYDAAGYVDTEFLIELYFRKFENTILKSTMLQYFFHIPFFTFVSLFLPFINRNVCSPS